MTKRQSPSPAPPPPTIRDLPPFEPVRVKFRHDGWTPERQRAFIGGLAECGKVRIAAEVIGMTPEGAYWLRRRPGAESFAVAWAAALARAEPEPPVLPPMTLREIAHVLDAARQRQEASGSG